MTTKPDLTKLSNEPNIFGTAHDIGVVLDLPATPKVDGGIVLTNAQARRLLALAIKAVS